MTNTDSAAYHQGAARHIRRFLFGPATITLVALFWLALFTSVSARTYTVKSGDTLERIAKRELGSSTRWQEIAQINHLPPPYKIRLHQQLTLPEQQATPMAPAIPANPFAASGVTPSPVQAQPAPRPPLFVTNSSPQVPRGNSLSTNTAPPATTSVPSQGTDEPSPKLSPWPVSIALFFGTFFYALNLRISCWFSNVEATYGRCLRLAIYLNILGILCLVVGILLLIAGVAFGIKYQVEPWSFAAAIAALPLTLVIWFFLSMLVIKKTLDCQWRNVVTLLIMSWFVSWVTGIIIFISTASYAPLAKLLSNLPKP